MSDEFSKLYYSSLLACTMRLRLSA